MSRVLPILFNTEMVRAILDGRKTVTRRVIKHNVDDVLNSPYHKEHPEVSDKTIIEKLCMPTYQPGDILYVRETWCNANKEGVEPDYYYFADVHICEDYDRSEWKWRPSIHMPKEAARIRLRVTDVRVERLGDIAAWEARKEGVGENCIGMSACGGGCETCPAHADNCILLFKELWDSTLKKSDLDRYGWDADPWVWVIEFERCEKPTDWR